jgi:site-specific DNA-methyltransferase (adenine-specific)
MQELIRDFTDEGELILDPFAGSGTTAFAAARLGRRFVGWEKDPDIHAAAMERLANVEREPGAADGQLMLGIQTLPGAEVA